MSSLGNESESKDETGSEAVCEDVFESKHLLISQKPCRFLARPHVTFPLSCTLVGVLLSSCFIYIMHMVLFYAFG